jgi:adenosyl cobinamide kinase/adenosyl cobinamide phosphate guanylyltransferase
VGLTLLIGGARSGKSDLGVRLSRRGAEPVTVVATAEPRDPEMAARIARHRAARPSTWTVIEEPVELAAALGRVPPGERALVDCLTMWVANLVDGGVADDAIVERAGAALEIAASRPAATIAITNEVGSGIVPGNELARRFRDLLGRVNRQWAAGAERALLVVAGRALPLQRTDDLVDG